jgi:hypothetical protein
VVSFVFAGVVIRFLIAFVNKRTKKKWKEIIKVDHKNHISNLTCLA